MTTTCTITKSGRCDTYGRPLLVGQSYTSSDDEIKSLWQAGFCSVTDAPTIFEAPTYPSPQQIACIGTPFVILPGDGASAGLLFTGSAGAFTLSAAIVTNAWNLLKGAWCYMPSGFGRSGYAAGWYWGIFSSDTAGVLYSDTYVSGRPVRDFSPTAFPVDLSGRLTQTTSEVTGPTGITLPGKSIGPNGTLKCQFRTMGTTTGTKTIKAYLDSTVVFGAAPAGNPVAEYLVSCSNQGVEDLQLTTASNSSLTGVGATGATLSTANYTAIDTASDRTLSISLQISTTATCAALLHADVNFTYGA